LTVTPIHSIEGSCHDYITKGDSEFLHSWKINIIKLIKNIESYVRSFNTGNFVKVHIGCTYNKFGDMSVLVNDEAIYPNYFQRTGVIPEINRNLPEIISCGWVRS
jgi:hypothetical protein